MRFQTTFVLFGSSSAVVLSPIFWGVFSDLFDDHVRFFDSSKVQAVQSLLNNNTNYEQLLVHSKVVFDVPGSSIPTDQFEKKLIKHRNAYVDSIESKLFNPDSEKIYNFFLKIQAGPNDPTYNPKPIKDLAKQINAFTLPRLNAFFTTFEKAFKDPRITKSIDAVAEKGFSFNSTAAWGFYADVEKFQEQYGFLPKEFTEKVKKTFEIYQA